MTTSRVLDAKDRLIRQMERSGKARTWYQEAATIPNLDAFTWSHFLTALESYQSERWEAVVTFFGLSVEEELASFYHGGTKPQYRNADGSLVALEDIKFEQLIKWAVENRLLSSDLGKKSHQVRKARNFFAHPYAVMREKIITGINAGGLSELIPDEAGIPDYVNDIFLATGGSTTSKGSTPIPAGILNSEEAAEKLAQATIEVLKALH